MKQAAYRKVAGEPVVPDEAPVGRVLEQLQGEDVVEARNSFYFGTHYVPQGMRFHDSHEFVKGWPECFKSVES